MLLLLSTLSVFLLAQRAHGADITFSSHLLLVNSSISTFDDKYSKVLGSIIEKGMSGSGKIEVNVQSSEQQKQQKHRLELPLFNALLRADINVKDNVDPHSFQQHREKYINIKKSEFVDFVTSGRASILFRKELNAANLSCDQNIGIIAVEVTEKIEDVDEDKQKAPFKHDSLIKDISDPRSSFVLNTHLGDSLAVQMCVITFILACFSLITYYASMYVIGLYRWKNLMEQNKQNSDKGSEDGGDTDSVVIGDVIMGTVTSDDFVAKGKGGGGGVQPDVIHSPHRRAGMSDISLSPGASSGGSGSLPMYSACESPSGRRSLEPTSPYRSMSLENFTKGLSKSISSMTGSPSKRVIGTHSHSHGGSPSKSPHSPSPSMKSSSMHNSPKSRSLYGSPTHNTHRSHDGRIQKGSPSIPFPLYIPNSDGRLSPKNNAYASPTHLSPSNRSGYKGSSIVGNELEIVMEEEERSKTNSTGNTREDDTESQTSSIASDEVIGGLGGLGLIDTIKSFWGSGKDKGKEDESENESERKESNPVSPSSVGLDKMNIDDLNCSIY